MQSNASIEDGGKPLSDALLDLGTRAFESGGHPETLAENRRKLDDLITR